jgi:hypothetical protein
MKHDTREDLPSETSNRPADETAEEIYQKMIHVNCEKEDYLLKLKRFILDFYVDRIFPEDNPGFDIYPDQLKFTTLRGEKVRSKSERDIADWFYRHQIDYKYEPRVNMKDFDFHPDFFIPEADLYLEHVSDLSYKMIHKEEQFDIGGKNCVKTFESIMRDSAVFNREMENIVGGRITNWINPASSLSYEIEFRGYMDKVNEYIKMAMQVQFKTKTRRIDLDELLISATQHEHERIRIFYELAIPLIKTVEQYCTDKSLLDFDDLLLQSIRLLDDDKTGIREAIREKFRYILVDEFQDVNSLQVDLLQQLIGPKTQLFCVGDDWQSIYSFRESEVDYILNFEKYFGPAEIISLDLNFRSTQGIVDVANEVISKNLHRLDKQIEAYKKTPGKVKLLKGKTENDCVRLVIDKIAYHLTEGFNFDDILILYRRKKMYSVYRNGLKEAGFAIPNNTIHGAKGEEAKIVFVVGLKDGSGGFPDIWLDDAIFREIGNVDVDRMMEEERRLFYVAITRAKDTLYLVTELGNESRFIDEIPLHLVDVISNFNTTDWVIPLCPECRTEIKEDYKFCPTCGRIRGDM